MGSRGVPCAPDPTLFLLYSCRLGIIVSKCNIYSLFWDISIKNFRPFSLNCTWFSLIYFLVKIVDSQLLDVRTHCLYLSCLGPGYSVGKKMNYEVMVAKKRAVLLGEWGGAFSVPYPPLSSPHFAFFFLVTLLFRGPSSLSSVVRISYSLVELTRGGVCNKKLTVCYFSMPRFVKAFM